MPNTLLAFVLGVLSIINPVNPVDSPSNLNSVIDSHNSSVLVAVDSDLKRTQYEDLVKINLVSLKESLESIEKLPIKKMDIHEVPNAKGAVILFPQSHRYPGSDIMSSQNDQAEIVQTEIYSIIKVLHEQNDIDLVMVEGEFYGEVDADKFSKIAKEMELQEELAGEIKALKDQSKNQKTINSLVDGLKNTPESLERKIILYGAPFKLKAEDKDNDLKIIGAENKETRAESAEIVRDYIYLKDREASLSAKAPNKLANMYVAEASLTNTISVDKTLKFLKLLCTFNHDQTLSLLVDEISETYFKLGELEEKNTILSSTPSRAENPYRTINDIKNIRELLVENEKKMTDIVLHRRNLETAENFSKALDSLGEEIGIIEFGAEHEEGLIKELNNQGISVLNIRTAGLK